MPLNELYLRDLNRSELHALRSYKSASDAEHGSACFDLNRDLRNGLKRDELPSSLDEIADGLDSVLARCPRLTEEVCVYRAIGWAWHLPLYDFGKCFRSFEYWSSCVSRDGIEAFLKAPSKCARGAVLTLHLPIGFPAYNMETLEGFGGHEAELLLPRAVLWKVRSARILKPEEVPLFVRPDFYQVIDAELDAQPWP
jgi:hypothetical protein